MNVPTPPTSTSSVSSTVPQDTDASVDADFAAREKKLYDMLSAETDPFTTVRTKMFAKAFAVSTPFDSELYRNLEKIEPIKIGDTYHGDAGEFLSATLQDEYLTLQTLLQKLSTGLTMKPLPGEAILTYIDRVINASLQNYLG